MNTLGQSRPKLFWQVLVACLTVSLLSLVAVSLYALRSNATARSEQVLNDLAARAHFVVEDMNLRVLSSSPADIDAYCKRMGDRTGTRITVMAADGKVLGDSLANPDRMEPHGDRPEFQQAFRDGRGVSQRYSGTLQREMLYLAMPIKNEGETVAAIRVSLPLLTMRQEFAEKRNNMVVAVLLTGLLAALVSAGISRRVTRPLQMAQQGVQRFAAGDFSYRLNVPDQQEVADLVVRLNHMAATLEQRMQTIREQGAEESAILAGMVEGVLAVGPDDRLLKVNDAAAHLLEVNAKNVEGRPVHEVLRHADLLSYIQHLRGEAEHERRDVLLQGATNRILEVNGSTLAAEGTSRADVIIVLHDVTRLRRLQRVRSEFVANVSHELKSPITSILGFAETLKDGALDEPEEARRFLDIIARQAHRMYNLIQDLLELSRIEDDSARGEIAREGAFIRPIAEAAVQQCSQRIEEQSVRIQLECDASVEANVNPPLLEQALVNLIDNAVKYSGADSTVTVRAELDGVDLLITVADQGQGIPKEHLPRLFERFYRVDKARSGEVCGTGLGLAIVKHIVQSHGGNVSAASTFGKGSTFTIRIPAA